MNLFSIVSLYRLLFIVASATFQLNCTAQNLSGSISIKESKINIPFILHDNRVFVQAIVNKKTFHFILDTGGGIVLDKDVSENMQLPLTRHGDITGAGEKPVPLYRTLVDTIAIGGLQILNKDAMVISLKEIKNALNLDFLDGVIGYEIFQQFITEINFAGSVVTLCEREVFDAPDNSYAIPFRLLNNRIPVITVNVDGTEAEFIVDTGDRTNLTIFPKFSDDNGFRNRYTLSDTLITGYGIGGPINAQQLVIKKVKLNNTLAVNDITARIPTIRSGAFNRSDSIKGSVGNGLLKNFTAVVFDYFNKIIYIKN